jgi:hypothetical protein
VDAFCSDTSTLLFSPEDILLAASAATVAQRSGVPFEIEIRVLQNDTGLQPSPAMYHGIPLDLQVGRSHCRLHPAARYICFLYAEFGRR